MEDVLRNACSMVLKDVTRLLDRVQDYEILIDDDKERALQIIKHVLGAELSDDEELDLSVTSYDLKLVRGLRPVSQDQVANDHIASQRSVCKGQCICGRSFQKIGF